MHVKLTNGQPENYSFWHYYFGKGDKPCTRNKPMRFQYD